MSFLFASGGPTPYARIRPPIWYQPPVVKLTVVDVASPADPAIVRETHVEGDYVNARRVDSRIHLVTSGRTPEPELVCWTDGSRQPNPAELAALEAGNRRAATLADWIPRWLDRATASAPSLALGPRPATALRKIVLLSISDVGIQANRVTDSKVECGALLVKP